MDTRRENPPPTAISGTVIQLGDHHRAAFYMRSGTCWIAEFHGDHGQVIDAATWMRTVPGALSCDRGRAAALATTTEITPETRERIEALHRKEDDDARRATAVSQAWAFGRRWCRELAAALRRSRTPRLHRS